MSNISSKKIRVGIVYGGRSNEHEVSLRSAASVFKRLNRDLFEAKTIYIDKTGTFHWANVPESFVQSSDASLPVAMHTPEITLLPRPHRQADGSSKAVFVYLDPAHAGKREEVDVLIPMLHGKNCEDGTLQGLFESAEVAYTGSGVLGSAIGMDKEVSKRLAELSGIPIVPYRVARRHQVQSELEQLRSDVEKSFGYPVFVKAAREGSSVGVYKVKSKEDFLPKLKEAFQYDSKILIERAIEAREIEFSVMENLNPSEAPLVSVPAEIIPTHEFYTYDAKYNDDNGAIFKIPAEISTELTKKLAQMAQKIFTTLELEGYARIDLFLDKNTNEYYLNEVNTLPGFTSISMFPKLFELSGIPYSEILTRLIQLAQRRNLKP